MNVNTSSKMHKRRDFVKLAGASGVSAALAGCVGGGDEDVVKIADMIPLSGQASIYGIPQERAAELAVEERNENGGLLGKEIEHLVSDGESDTQRYQELTRRYIQQEQVDMLTGTVLGASREAIRPIVEDEMQLTFLTQQYSGGLCSQPIFNTGADATQQMSEMIPYMIEEFGSDVYIPFADYNYGLNSARRAEGFIEEAGGNVVGEEAIPLDVDDFTSLINTLNATDPDWIMHILVGNNHQNFFTQADNANLDIPIATPLAMGETYDHITLDPPIMEDVHTCMSYFQEIDTSEAEEFNEAMLRDDNVPYVSQAAKNKYIAYLYYFEAVEEAGTTDQQEVSQVLESGEITIDSPEGEIRMTEVHSSTHNMRLARADENNDLEFLETYEDMEPTWLQENCTLGPDDRSTWDNPRTEWIEYVNQ